MDRHGGRKLTTQEFWYFGTPGWGQNAPPGPPPGTDDNQLNANDWVGMIDVVQGIHVTPTVGKKEPKRSFSSASMKSLKGANKPWIERIFQKRECSKFIPMPHDPTKCGCGRQQYSHSSTAIDPSQSNDVPNSNDINSDQNTEKWSISKHTIAESTDAYGTIEFQGGPHPFKAQYVRVAFDTDPADLIFMFDRIWKIQPPKLVITVHGGIDNFDLQPNMARAFQDGLMKAASTAGAWIITSGVNTGVVRHLAAALESNASASRGRSRIVTIGIAPWGLLKKRDSFLGRNTTVAYHSRAFSPKGPFVVLNDRHSCYVFVDNGTIGRYGAEIVLRQRLEEYIAQKQQIEGSTRKVPVVGIIVEGGTCAIRAVLDYVTNIPPIPVVVCDGSGRAADLIAFAHRYVQDDGMLPEAVKSQLLSLAERAFKYNKGNADKAMRELLLCVQMHNLVTIFRLGDDGPQQDVDHAILTALLKGQTLPAPDQLALTIAWNRVDIAQSDVFVLGQEWPAGCLHSAMMDALVNDRVDFVRLLLKNGVSMHKFLTFERLEELYNTDRGPPNTLYYIVRRVVKVVEGYRYTLPDIGLAIEKLTGYACQSAYTTDDFRAKYAAHKGRRKQKSRSPALTRETSVINFDPASGSYEMGSMRSRALRNHVNTSMAKNENRTSPLPHLSAHETSDPENGDETPFADESPSNKRDFDFPFSDLLTWAVLTKRHEMALCMWQHGEEAMAKALMASMLFRSLSEEASYDYLEIDLRNDFKKHAEEFGKLSVELLDQCHQQDEGAALQLLTYELKNWGGQTCLSLAVNSSNRPFVAHPCCQILIADLWHGGLRMRRYPNLKVLIGLLCPLFILFLEFKSHEELKLQPTTALEHAADVDDDNVSTDNEFGPYGIDNTAVEVDVKESKERKKPATPTKTLSIKKREVPRFIISNEEGDHYSLGGTALSESSLNACDSESSMAPRKRSSVIMPRTRRSLPWRRRLYEFCMAPITTYWTWTLSYILFISAYTYVLLIDLPVRPTEIEWFLVVYVAIFALERCRLLLVSGPPGFTQRLKAFCARPANFLTTLAVILFIIGFIFRLIPDHRHSSGRVILVLSLVVWQLKTLEYLNVHKAFGLYIYIVKLMVQSTFAIMVLLTVGIMVFGTVKQTIHYPHEQFSWNLVKNIFFKAHLMLYGELFKDDIDGCDDMGDQDCVPGNGLPIVVMAIYLLITCVLLLNLLIAIFSNILTEKNKISQQVWLSDRYASVMEYESTSFLPPPLTLISHIYMVIKFIRIHYFSKHASTVRGRSAKIFDFSLKLFLNKKQQKILYAFEEDQMDLLMRNKDNILNSSQEQIVRRTAERMRFRAEGITLKMSDLISRETALRNEIREKDAQMNAMEQSQREILDLLHKLSYKLSHTQGILQPPIERKYSGQDTLTPILHSRKPSNNYTSTNTAVGPSPPPPMAISSSVYDETTAATTAAPSVDAVDRSDENLDAAINPGTSTPSPKTRKFQIVVVEKKLEEIESSGSESEDEGRKKKYSKKSSHIVPPNTTRWNSTVGDPSNIPSERLAYPVSALCLQKALIQQVPLDRYPNKSSMPNLMSGPRSTSLKERRAPYHDDDSFVMNYTNAAEPIMTASLPLTPTSNEDPSSSTISPSLDQTSNEAEQDTERRVTFAKNC